MLFERWSEAHGPVDALGLEEALRTQHLETERLLETVLDRSASMVPSSVVAVLDARSRYGWRTR